MYIVTQELFEEIINDSIDSLPIKYISKLKNVAIVTADNPSQVQRKKLKLKNNQSLYGLYEGIPLTQRGSNYNLVLPDIITLFKQPIENSVNDLNSLKEAIRLTLWHEIAHYFGLSHKQIHKLDGSDSH